MQSIEHPLNDTALSIPHKRDVQGISTRGHGNGFLTVLAQTENLRSEGSETFLRFWHFCLLKFFIPLLAIPSFSHNLLLKSHNIPSQVITAVSPFVLTAGHKGPPHAVGMTWLMMGVAVQQALFPKLRCCSSITVTVFPSNILYMMEIEFGGNWFWSWPSNLFDTCPSPLLTHAHPS